MEWYSKRLEVIEEIRRVTTSRRIPIDTAVKVVKDNRVRLKLTMNKLCQWLRENKKLREAL
jgi:hypothetical protein